MLFLAGFVDSVAGGGGLISLPSYLFVGVPIHLAAGTNKVVNAIGTGTATWKYLRSGKVDLRTALWAAVGALAGGALGADWLCGVRSRYCKPAYWQRCRWLLR